MPDVTVSWRARAYEVGSSGTLTFGRSNACTICLDVEDLGISRLAGRISYDGARWILENTSDRRAFDIVAESGLRAVFAPGQVTVLSGRVVLQVEGHCGRHVLTVAAPKAAGSDEQQPSGAETVTGDGVRVSQDDRLVLTALFAGFLLDPPRYDPHPRSYEAAARRLKSRPNGDRFTASAVRKRIEHLKDRLRAAKVPNLTGPSALYGLAEWALTGRKISKEDLGVLDL